MIDELWQLKGMFFGLFDDDENVAEVYKVIHVTPEAHAVGVLINDKSKIDIVSRSVGRLSFFKTESETISHIVNIATARGWLEDQDDDQPKPSNAFDLEEVLKELPMVKD